MVGVAVGDRPLHIDNGLVSLGLGYQARGVQNLLSACRTVPARMPERPPDGTRLCCRLSITPVAVGCHWILGLGEGTLCLTLFWRQ